MRWFILFLLFVARIGLGFQFQTVGSVSSELVSEFGFTYTEIGSLIGFFMLPGMFLAMPAGFAGRFMSDRFIVGLGLLVLGAGGVLAALAESYALLSVARLVNGMGFVVSTIFLTKIIVDWFAGKELATAMGVLVMSWPFGIAMGQVSHGWLAINYDWRFAFALASIYCVVSGLLVMAFCREAPGTAKSTASLRFTLNRNEVVLIIIASVVWGLFNAGYIVYLSFAPRALVDGGYDMVSALGVISLASWIMIFSGAACGQVADRSGKPDIVIYVCMLAAIIALIALFVTPMALFSSLLFGLVGIAPAGVIVALAASAMRPENRAIGMGLFFTIYFVIQTPAPGIAGWLFDISSDAKWPISFAASLFFATALATLAFRIMQRRLPI